jgi:hypothetical protein
MPAACSSSIATPGSIGNLRAGRRALAVGQPDHRHAGLVDPAVGDARIGVGERPRVPAVDHVHRRVVGERHRGPFRVRHVAARAHDGVRHQARAVLSLGVVAVRELEPLVHVVIGASLGLGRAHRALGEDGQRPRLAVDHALQRAEVVGRHEVVAVQELGVEREVDEVGERARPAGRRDVVEAHDREGVVGVGLRVAGRGAVVGDRGAVGVAVRLVELRHRGAHPDRHEHGRGALDRLGHAARVVVVEAQVEDVLEGPDAPRDRGVVGRGVVVRHRDREGLARDARAALLQQLGRAAPEQVLRDVEVVLDQRDALAVRPLHHERPHAQARLDAV